MVILLKFHQRIYGEINVNKSDKDNADSADAADNANVMVAALELGSEG